MVSLTDRMRCEHASAHASNVSLDASALLRSGYMITSGLNSAVLNSPITLASTDFRSVVQHIELPDGLAHSLTHVVPVLSACVCSVSASGQIRPAACCCLTLALLLNPLFDRALCRFNPGMQFIVRIMTIGTISSQDKNMVFQYTDFSTYRGFTWDLNARWGQTLRGKASDRRTYACRADVYMNLLTLHFSLLSQVKAQQRMFGIIIKDSGIIYVIDNRVLSAYVPISLE